MPTSSQSPVRQSIQEQVVIYLSFRLVRNLFEEGFPTLRLRRIAGMIFKEAFGYFV